MFYSSKQLAKTLLDLSNEKPDQEKQIVDNFLAFCEKKNLIQRLPNILARLEELNERQKRSTNLIIETKNVASDKVIKEIKSYINADKNTDITTEVNELIQGGFIAKYQGKIYDGSVKNQIEKIKTALRV